MRLKSEPVTCEAREYCMAGGTQNGSQRCSLNCSCQSGESQEALTKLVAGGLIDSAMSVWNEKKDCIVPR